MSLTVPVWSGPEARKAPVSAIQMSADAAKPTVARYRSSGLHAIRSTP